MITQLPLLYYSDATNEVTSSSWIIAFQDWNGYGMYGVQFGGGILSNSVNGDNLAITVGGVASGSDCYQDYTHQKAIAGSGSFFVSNSPVGEIIWQFDFNSSVALHAIYFGQNTSSWVKVKIRRYVNNAYETVIENVIVNVNSWLVF